jgi:hypothetical protein
MCSIDTEEKAGIHADMKVVQKVLLGT